MFRFAMMITLGFSMGCVSHGNTRADVRLDRFEAFVDTQQVYAPQRDIIRATQAVLAEHGWTPTEAGTFAGRIVVKGTPRRAAMINARLPDNRVYVAGSGCRVDIFPSARAHTLRVTCHGQQPAAPMGMAAALPRRAEWPDRYLAAHIIERINPAQGQRIWRAEPTGQRTFGCAIHAVRRAGIPAVCIGSAMPVGASGAAVRRARPAQRRFPQPARVVPPIIVQR